MSIEKAKECLRRFGAEDRIQEFDVSSATVDLAAAALGVDASRIAKTLSFKKDGGCLLVVTSGDARVDNRKFRDTFACKAKMLTPEEAESMVGHSVGGVCPFGRNKNVPVWLDCSLRRFDLVYPAAGSASSAIGLAPDELYVFSEASGWVDVCKIPV